LAVFVPLVVVLLCCSAGWDYLASRMEVVNVHPSVLAISKSDLEVATLLPPESGQLEGEVQGGEA
jgi:hypothetical protein